MNPVQIDSERWLVKTSCHECFVDVEFSKEYPDSKWIELSLLSTHDGFWRGHWRNRLAQAWRVLRGRAGWWLDLNTDEETDALISVLNLARANAFGFPPPVVTQGSANTNIPIEFTITNAEASDE